MRISTNQIFEQNLNAMLEQQAAVSKTQLQLSTGRRILTPADDPAGAAQALDLTRVNDTTQQYQANSDAARARLGLEENALGTAGDLLQRARELAVQANNDSQTNESRRGIAQEARQLLQELLGLANTKDANNEYIFAGHKGFTTPFAANGSGGFTYSGDQGQRFLQVGPSLQVAVSDSGTEVFQLIRNGNGTYVTNNNLANTGNGVINAGGVNGTFVSDTYTLAFSQPTPSSPITYTVTGTVSGLVASGTYSSGAAISFNGVQVSVTGTPANGDTFTVTPSVNQDMFTTLQGFITTLETNFIDSAGRARLHNAMNRTLADLDQALGNIIETRATVGGRLKAVDNQADANAAFSLQLQQSLSQVQDLDFAEAISRLNRQLLSLQAAQQAFVRIQGLSLFNFLR